VSDDNHINNASIVPGVTPSRVERFTQLALDQLTIGLASNGQPFAYDPQHPNRIVHPLKSGTLKRLIRKMAHKRGDFLRNDEVADILENLSAHAAVEDLRWQVFLRVGRNEDGDVELDLGTQDARRVRFKDGEAEILTSGSTTLFMRPDSLLPLPEPAESGDWRLLLSFLNMKESDQLLLIGNITYPICHPRGSGPYLISVVQGRQGDGKSELARILRRLIDNNAAGIQLFPSERKDMAISCGHQYLLVYDNVRSLSKGQSDDLCVLSTGGTMGSRRLYTDDEESLLYVHTPVVLNGIHAFVQEPDLASRCLTIHLLPIPPESRREEADIERELAAKLPMIFRGLLDLCAAALAVENQVKVTHPERMMNFCRWLAALEQVIPLPKGSLQQAYSDNLREAALETVQDNALASTVLTFATKQAGGHWSGRPSDLLSLLTNMAPQNVVHRQAEWPQSAPSLSKRLKQAAPLLNAQGLDLAFSHGTERKIEISYTPPVTTGLTDEPDGTDDNPEQSASAPDLSACTPTNFYGADEA
jgi:hypothetical protein